MTINTNMAVTGGAGLALLGTTCCALPMVLVALGLGGVVASTVSALPFLVVLSQYKAVTFSATALVLGYSWRQVRRVSICEIKDARKLRTQRVFLWTSTIVFVLAVLASYAMYPIVVWFERFS